MSGPSKKRSHSIARTDLSTHNEQIVNDIYQSSLNTVDLFPPINLAMVINTNHISSPKNNNNPTLTRPKLLQYIEENLIGKNLIFQGPWGLRRSTNWHLLVFLSNDFFLLQVIYCDYTASGRPLHFIESFIRNHVLPLYVVVCIWDEYFNVVWFFLDMAIRTVKRVYVLNNQLNFVKKLVISSRNPSMLMKTMFSYSLEQVQRVLFIPLWIISIFMMKSFEAIQSWLSVHSNITVIFYHGKKQVLK